MKKTLIVLAIFLAGCQGGKRVNPDSSGAVNIIRASKTKPTEDSNVMNVIPKRGAVKSKPNFPPTSSAPPNPTQPSLIPSVPAPPLVAPEPPTVQRNKLDIVIKHPEGKPAVPIVVSKQMTLMEEIDLWIHDNRWLIAYYLVVFTGLLILWFLWNIRNEKRALKPKTPKQGIKTKKRTSTKRSVKKTAKKATAKKAVKRTAKKKAPKNKS